MLEYVLRSYNHNAISFNHVSLQLLPHREHSTSPLQRLIHKDCLGEQTDAVSETHIKSSLAM
jgi:hypothetical protein